MKKICIVTGTRAEFGLMAPMMNLIDQDAELELQLIATGMHLSPEFGYTIQDIEREGFKVDRKIEILLSSDSAVGVSKSMGLAQISFAEAYEELKPDLVLVLGDRYEIFAAVATAMVARIPIAHLHGGEKTEGAIDESIRHAISKMSQLHFTATEEYKNRVIQMGEQPAKVFNVGAVGLDNIFTTKLLNKEAFEESINFKLKKRNILVTFHPVTLEKGMAEKQFTALLEALSELEDTAIIITHSNSDMEGRKVIEMTKRFAAEHPEKVIDFASLGSLRYLSALQFMDAMVGNSSSGIVEAPAFQVPTINIGNRQKGRIMAKSIVNCDPNTASIRAALKQAFSPEFIQDIQDVQSPYGSGGSSEKLVEILKQTSFSDLLSKTFYDIKF